MLFPVVQESEKFASGRVTFLSGGASNLNHIVLGFRPKYLCISRGSGDTGAAMYCYDSRYSTAVYRFSNSSHYAEDKPLGTTDTAHIYSINHDGFTVTGTSSATSKDFFAIG